MLLQGAVSLTIGLFLLLGARNDPPGATPVMIYGLIGVALLSGILLIPIALVGRSLRKIKQQTNSRPKWISKFDGCFFWLIALFFLMPIRHPSSMTFTKFYEGLGGLIGGAVLSLIILKRDGSLRFTFTSLGSQILIYWGCIILPLALIAEQIPQTVEVRKKFNQVRASHSDNVSSEEAQTLVCAYFDAYSASNRNLDAIEPILNLINSHFSKSWVEGIEDSTGRCNGTKVAELVKSTLLTVPAPAISEHFEFSAIEALIKLEDRQTALKRANALQNIRGKYYNRYTKLRIRELALLWELDSDELPKRIGDFYNDSMLNRYELSLLGEFVHNRKIRGLDSGIVLREALKYRPDNSALHYYLARHLLLNEPERSLEAARSASVFWKDLQSRGEEDFKKYWSLNPTNAVTLAWKCSLTAVKGTTDSKVRDEFRSLALAQIKWIRAKDPIMSNDELEQLKRAEEQLNADQYILGATALPESALFQ